MNLVATAEGIGRLDGDEVALLDLPHPDLVTLFGEPDWRETVAGAAVIARTSIAHHGNGELLPPLRPGAFWLVGSNYPGRSGAAPPRPAFYLRSSSSLSGPGEQVRLPAATTVQPDAELAVVIGAPAYRIAESAAWEAIAGITACNDLTDRDRLTDVGAVATAKSRPGFGALGGSVLLTEGPVDVEVRLDVDGEVRQQASTDEMLFSVAELVSRLSYDTRLMPGDVIATGSPTPTTPTRLAPGQSTTVTVTGVVPLTTKFITEEH